MSNKVIAVDFDGTVCRSRWPEIGEENTGLIEWLKGCQANGDKLILFTCREGALLEKAVAWCTERGLIFDAVNDNLPELVQKYGNNCRKVSADIYLDDKAIGVYYPPKETCLYINGTKGMFMRTEVTLNTEEELIPGERAAESDKRVDEYFRNRLRKAGMPPVCTMQRVPVSPGETGIEKAYAGSVARVALEEQMSVNELEKAMQEFQTALDENRTARELLQAYMNPISQEEIERRYAEAEARGEVMVLHIPNDDMQ